MPAFGGRRGGVMRDSGVYLQYPRRHLWSRAWPILRFLSSRRKLGAWSVTAVPAMPAVPASQLYRGSPFLLLQGDERSGIGWQDNRKAGPCFVVARYTAVGTTKVVERFPMTEDGWARAWRALTRLDPEVARAVAARLAARAAAERARADLARLDADSACSLRGVIFLGGYAAGAALAAGASYDLRFLGNRLGVFPHQVPGVVIEIAYGDVEALDIGGPGLVKRWSPGGQAALTWLLGLPGAVLAVSTTKIQTIVRIHAADCELFFLDTQQLADALRIELSVPLKAIRNARSAPAGNTEHPEPTAPESIAGQLTRLASMLDAGLLTRSEFDHLKTKLIADS